jgi:type VI protein secretion system component VasF
MKYVARRLVDRERALADESRPFGADALRELKAQRRWAAFRAFVFGILAGFAALFVTAWLWAPPG